MKLWASGLDITTSVFYIQSVSLSQCKRSVSSEAHHLSFCFSLKRTKDQLFCSCCFRVLKVWLTGYRRPVSATSTDAPQAFHSSTVNIIQVNLKQVNTCLQFQVRKFNSKLLKQQNVNQHKKDNSEHKPRSSEQITNSNERFYVSCINHMLAPVLKDSGPVSLPFCNRVTTKCTSSSLSPTNSAHASTQPLAEFSGT